MSNHDLKPTDYSNTVLVQNDDNASVVSIFPLVNEESAQTPQETQEIPRSAPAVPQTVSGGGSGY